jgi:toxin ParE1/3/4
MSVSFSPAAEADLVDIALFIAADSPRRAESFVAELEAKCELLGREPGIGTGRPELGRGVRVLPHGAYLVFHRRSSSGVRIERILHGSRDIGAGDLPPGDSA